MKVSRKTLVMIISCIALTSCITNLRDEVHSTIESQTENDGQIVTIQGFLKTNNNYYNLFSGDGKVCIGLLLTDTQRQRFQRLVDKRVFVKGRLDAEGCGRRGICVEHICGPTILTDVLVLKK